MRLAGVCLLTALAVHAAEPPEDKPAYTFGTTAVNSSDFEGRVFYMDPGAERLPNFKKLNPVGKVYTPELNVWPQRFNTGFPGITDRFEWFAIDYAAKLWIDKAGTYNFSLLSDDGAKLRINNQLVIDNDGLHRAMAASATVALTRGVYDINVSYFQGPRFTVALVLSIAPPGERWRILNTRDFKPPQDLDQWTPGSLKLLDRNDRF